MAKKKRTSQSYEIVKSYTTPTHYEASPSPSPSLKEVEIILNYQFRDISLLEAALTHSSYSDSPSYQRLEFIGDAALGLAVANFVFIKYPGLHPGMLSLLRSANISTEKLARVAVRHNLFGYVRHKAPPLALKVNEFSLAIEQEGDEILPYEGLVKAPKVLADITESVAAAIYVDCNFNLKLLWKFFSPLLEPIVTVENIQQQPVTMVYQICQKEGKSVKFTHCRKGTQNFTNIFVNGMLMGSGSSEKKKISKLSAAKQALDKLWMSQALPTEEVHCSTEGSNGVDEICGANEKLIEFCYQKQWPMPTYRVRTEVSSDTVRGKKKEADVAKVTREESLQLDQDTTVKIVEEVGELTSDRVVRFETVGKNGSNAYVTKAMEINELGEEVNETKEPSGDYVDEDGFESETGEETGFGLENDDDDNELEHPGKASKGRNFLLTTTFFLLATLLFITLLLAILPTTPPHSYCYTWP